AGPVEAFQRPYVPPKTLVPGGQFADRILPMRIDKPLVFDVWGGDNVLPRNVANGIEDSDYSYWGGNIVKGDDGKYHMFPCRWREDHVVGDSSGHMTWGQSEVVHAVADKPTGPYKVVSVIGPGHNPEIYRRKDGSYIIGVMRYKAYRADTLGGPWTAITPSFQWLQSEQNTTNRTYAIRDDGVAIMMNKNGKMYISENADEQFIQLTEDSAFRRYSNSIMEDPVIWRDEVQYHCIYNDALGRTAFYMRSADGIHWKWIEGVAYSHRSVLHETGSYEDWFKLERPKILQDEYGRATHINFAAIDTHKRKDIAGDKHSSKNLVLALRVPQRMEILNESRLTQDTSEIRVKVFAEEGFDPGLIDLSKTRFGSPEIVNKGGGAGVVASEFVGNDLIITSNGASSGFEDHNFAGKLLGVDRSGEMVFGYAKMKPSMADLVDQIVFQTIPDEISVTGEARFAVYHKTRNGQQIRVDLINQNTGERVRQTQAATNTGKALSVVSFPAGEFLNIDDPHTACFYLENVEGELVSDVLKKQLVIVAQDAPSDKIEMSRISSIPESGTLRFKLKFEAKTKRDIHLEFVQRDPMKALYSQVVGTVDGRGETVIEFEIDPSYGVKRGKPYRLTLFTTRQGGGKDARVSNKVNLWLTTINNDAFKERHPDILKEAR
ncbi:MAG: glycoside hydrolase family protein, partial [Planctomycetota bacterium]